MVMRVAAGLCVVALGSGAIAQGTGTLAERIVGTRWLGGQVVLLDAKSQGQLEMNVVAVASATRVPAGIETLVDSRGERGDGASVVLTGMPLGRAFDLVMARAPRLESAPAQDRYQYAWSEGNGVVHVSAFGSRRTFLDTVVPLFETKDSTLGDALIEVHRHLDPPGQRRGAVFLSSGPGIERTYEATKVEDPGAFTRRFSLMRRNARIRDLLDAIVVANRNVSWIVRYQTLEGSYEASVVYLVTGDYRYLTAERRR